MNQIAATRRINQPVAALDLTDERQRRVQELIDRTHTGRWPLWRGYAMYRSGDCLHELVEWVPRGRTVEARRFSVLTWTIDLNTVGAQWQRQHMTRAQAAALFAEIKRNNRARVDDIGIRIAV